MANCYPPPAGLIAWWPADGDYKDYAGTHHGTPVGGMSLTPGFVGQAFNLDGSTGYVDVGTGFDLDSMTLEAWVSIDPAQNKGERRIISKDSHLTEPVRKGFSIKSSTKYNTSTGLYKSNDGRPGFGVMIGPKNYFSKWELQYADAAVAPIALGAGWHHLVGVRDKSAGRLELYVDGVMVASKANPIISGAIDCQARTVVGQVGPAFPAEFFRGNVDESRIYNRALSAAEIKGIFDAGRAGMCKPSVAFYINHLAFLPGDPSVDTAFNAVQDGGLVISSTTLGENALGGGNKVISAALQTPPGYDIVGVRVCYQSSSANSFISQIRIAQLQNPPSTWAVLLDDGTDLTNPGPVCVASAATMITPSLGALLLSLRVNFGLLTDKIVIRGVALMLRNQVLP